MTRLKWGDPAKRFFETGLDRGVLFPKGTPPAGTIVAKNFLKNPRLKSAGATVEVARNLMPNPKIISLTDTLTGHSAGLTEIVDADGTHWARKPASNGSADWFYFGLIATAYSHYYSYRMTVRAAPGVVVTAQSTDNIAGPVGQATQITIPASGVVELVVPSYDSSVQSDGVYVGLVCADQIDVTKVAVYEVAGPNQISPYGYFDGDTTDDSITTYSWTGTANASPSTKVAQVPNGWGNTSYELARNLVPNPSFEVDTSGYTSNCVVTRDTAWSVVGAASLSLSAPNTTNDSSAALDGDAGAIRAGMVPGKTYTVSGTVNTPTAQTGTLNPRARRIVAFTKVGAAAYVETLSPEGPVTGSARVSVTFTVPADATEAFIRFYNGSGVAGEIVRWDAISLVEGSKVVPYFDGNTPDSLTDQYSWVGAANASASVWNGSTGMFIDSSMLSPTTGDPSVKLVGNGEFGGQGIYWSPVAIPELMVGQDYGIQIKIKAPLGSQLQVYAISQPDGAGTKMQVITGTGSWKTVTITGGKIAANKNPYIIVRTLYELPFEKINFWVCDAMIFTGTEAPVYFDGDATDDEVHTYAWDGTANNSISTKTENESLAVPWDGLTSVDETGADAATAYYVDGRPFLFLPKPKEYAATLKAVTYPDEFAAIMGLVEATDGMYLDSQQPDAFDLCYRTKIGDGVSGEEAGYKIHLVYNATVAPAGNSYQSLGGAINPLEFSWDIQAVPVPVTGYRPTAHIVIDTRHMDSEKLAAIEGMLYGDDTHLPSMRNPQVILDLLSYGNTIVINDLGNGEWEAVGSYKNIYLIGDGVFEIDNVNGTVNGDGTFTISSTP